MTSEASKSPPNDLVVVSVDKIVDEPNHSHPPYIVGRLLKSSKRDNKLVLKGGILDVEIDSGQKPVFITSPCPSDWTLVHVEYINDKGKLVKEVRGTDNKGREVKGGTTMVFGNLSYIIGTGWRANYALIYGVEHDDDFSIIKLTPEDKDILWLLSQQQKEKLRFNNEKTNK